MDEGFGDANRYIEERDKARRQLEVALEDNRALRQLLAEIRPVLITNQHKRAIDVMLANRPARRRGNRLAPWSGS